MPYGDAEALAAAVTDETAAVVLEPIQGEAGVVVPPDGYLADARRITREHGALLWLDEVQTGIGRTGRLVRRRDRAPASSPTSSPSPRASAAASRSAPASASATPPTCSQPGNHGTTFGGNPVACAAALAVLDTIEDDGLLDHVTELGRAAARRPGRTTRGSPRSRGRGLLIGLDLDRRRAVRVVARRAARTGFIVNTPDPDTVRLAPPLVLDRR